ncbi:ABC transporter permease [Inconstantimicrobium mannanitabidum]|uniref:Uncharacterized protein n=1 Tax=Inconstantimicrobium mannanitabidum TaxID=1604901 RepID=A0ACB5RCQ5_9CLOT|nr:ABC transporter permease [Clostridium sp. TW13]GKX67043.1 hypothetical protein rsdtw13_23010 [Clostridium sp. TW13]
MKRKLFRSWKNKYFNLFIIVLGYVLCITIMSLVINSYILNKRNSENDQQGKKENFSYVLVRSNPSKNFQGNIIDVITEFSKYGKVDVLKLRNSILSFGKKQVEAQIIPTEYRKDTDFIPMITLGRYISIDESVRGDKVAVIGKSLAKSLGVGINGKINFYGEEYKIIGILGPEFKESVWDKVFTTSVKGLPKSYLSILNDSCTEQSDKNKILNLNLTFRVKNSERQKVFDEISNSMNKYGVQIIESFGDMMDGGLGNAVFGITVITIPIIIAALFNVLNISFFWIMDRKKEITIKKVMGATNEYIIKRIRIELILISLISAGTSFIIQNILYRHFEQFIENTGLSFKLSVGTFIACTIIAVMLGYLSTIIPTRKIVSMEAAEALRYE